MDAVSKVVGVMTPRCLFPGAHLARLAPSKAGVLGGGGMAPRAPGVGPGRRHGLGGMVSSGGGGGAAPGTVRGLGFVGGGRREPRSELSLS